MSKMQVLGISLVILLVALPLVSIGSVRESPGLWGTGLVLLVLGAITAPITRFVFEEENDDDEAGEGEKDRKEQNEERETKEKDERGEGASKA